MNKREESTVIVLVCGFLMVVLISLSLILPTKSELIEESIIPVETTLQTTTTQKTTKHARALPIAIKKYIPKSLWK